MKTVTIIIPVYNAAPWLNECILSARNQSYRNLEIIIVNDGSTDESPMIIGSHLKEDSRIHFISQENRGLSAARNAGLDACSGDWIMFLDADDLLERDAVGTLLNMPVQNTADMIVFGSLAFAGNDGISPKETERTNQLLRTGNISYSGNEITEKAFFTEPCLGVYVWNKLYRKSLISDLIRFDESILFGEDRCFLFDIAPLLRSLVMTGKVLHRYRLHGASSLTGRYAGRAYDRTVWKLRILEHIFQRWMTGGDMTARARKNLLHWAEQYIDRSLHDLSPEESGYIRMEYKRISDLYQQGEESGR